MLLTIVKLSTRLSEETEENFNFQMKSFSSFRVNKKIQESSSNEKFPWRVSRSKCTMQLSGLKVTFHLHKFKVAS